MYSNDRNLIFGDSLQSPTVMFSTPYNEHDSGHWFMSYAEQFGRTTLHYLVAGPVRTKVDLVYAIIKGVAYGDSTAITSVQRQPEPVTFVVSTAYPNPFNATTRIAYSLSQTCRITAIIIDMSGRIVAQYDEGLRAPGTHLFRWGASHFPSGVYFVRLNAGQQTSTSKCLLLK